MSKNKGLTEIASGSLWVFIGLISGYILGYTNNIIIARFFGPYDYGVISLALTFVIMLSSFSLLGLHTGATRYIAIYMGKGRNSEMTAVLRGGLKVIIPISILISILFYLCKGFIINHFFKKLPDPIVIIPFIFLIPMVVSAEYFQSCLRGLKLAKYAIFSKEIIRRLTTLFILLATIFIWKNLIYVSLAYLFGFVVYMISAALWTRKNIFFSSNKKPNKFKLKELVTFSLPLVFSSILMQIGLEMSNIFLGYFKGPKEVGLFSVALPYSRFIGFPLMIILFMFLPVMSDYWNKDKNEELREIFKTICRWLYIISGLFFLIFVLYSELIIIHSFGKEFQPAHKALIILSVGQFFNAICGPTGSLLLAAGKSKEYFIGDLISIIFSLVLFPVFVPKFGFLGAAYVSLTQMVVLNLVRLYFIYNMTKLLPFSPRMIGSIIVLVILGILLKTSFTTINIWLQLLTLISIYFMLMLLMQVFHKEDIIFLHDFLRRKLSHIHYS